MRSSFNDNSLIIKLRVTNNYTYSNNVDIYSFL